MIDSSQTASRLEELLRREFSPSRLEVEDQSYQHVGHRAAGGGGHFFVVIQSKRFTGLSPIARQRLVLDSIKSMMDREIHALSMKCIPE